MAGNSPSRRLLTLALSLPQDGAVKDATGSLADKEGASPVLKAISAIRAAFPSLYIACDLCLCAYTEHGHCGIIHHDAAAGPCIDNAASIARLAGIAVAYAKAGAHVSRLSRVACSLAAPLLQGGGARCLRSALDMMNPIAVIHRCFRVIVFTTSAAASAIPQSAVDSLCR